MNTQLVSHAERLAAARQHLAKAVDQAWRMSRVESRSLACPRPAELAPAAAPLETSLEKLALSWLGLTQ